MRFISALVLSSLIAGPSAGVARAQDPGATPTAAPTIAFREMTVTCAVMPKSAKLALKAIVSVAESKMKLACEGCTDIKVKGTLKLPKAGSLPARTTRDTYLFWHDDVEFVSKTAPPAGGSALAAVSTPVPNPYENHELRLKTWVSSYDGHTYYPWAGDDDANCETLADVTLKLKYKFGGKSFKGTTTSKVNLTGSAVEKR